MSWVFYWRYGNLLLCGMMRKEGYKRRTPREEPRVSVRALYCYYYYLLLLSLTFLLLFVRWWACIYEWEESNLRFLIRFAKFQAVVYCVLK